MPKIWHNTLVEVEANKKTSFASYFLKGEANYWWESKKMTEKDPVVTWEMFTELFLEKYFPKYLQNQMEAKFLEIKQENLSVVKYENKFTRLARFVPEYVETDEKRAKRFQQGLKPVREKVMMISQMSHLRITKL